jgi:hypothetical protein
VLKESSAGNVRFHGLNLKWRQNRPRLAARQSRIADATKNGI